jgi:SlyX protein
VEDRIVELEIKVAFQERTIAELEGVLTEYAAKLDALCREVEALRARLDDGGDPGPIVDEPPPHY